MIKEAQAVELIFLFTGTDVTESSEFHPLPTLLLSFEVGQTYNPGIYSIP